MDEHPNRWFGITKDDVILAITFTAIVVLPLSGFILYTVIFSIPREIFGVVLGVFGIAGVPAGAFVVWRIIRWTNRRDDPRLAQPGGDGHDGKSPVAWRRELSSEIGCCVAELAAVAVSIYRSLANAAVLTSFRVIRAAFVTAVAWCTATLAVALYVRVPGKPQPGSYFSDNAVPLVLEISFCLFFVGAIWCILARPPRESRAMRASVYAAFAEMVIAQLVTLQML